MKAVGVCTEVCVSPPIVTGEHRTGVGGGFILFFLMFLGMDGSFPACPLGSLHVD